MAFLITLLILAEFSIFRIPRVAFGRWICPFPFRCKNQAESTGTKSRIGQIRSLPANSLLTDPIPLESGL